ncbi:MAG: dolichol-phosphate mannosyltransferase [Rickettsiales bacterium]|jgi:dolichol-phosphate mannosyltransferase
MTKQLVSIVISAYNEEKNLPELYRQLLLNLEKCTSIDYELIFVNDGSHDQTLFVLKLLAAKDAKVRIVNFARNFGHEVAMTAGLDHSKGSAVIFMDADLQHPPELIPQIIAKWQEGYDVVLTKIIENKDKTVLSKFLSKAYYKLINTISDVNIPSATPDFRLIGSTYISTIKDMRENSRMFRGMLSWLGMFKCAEIEFIAPKRLHGKTNYNLIKSFALAFDSILQFSIKPLRISIYFSIICAFFSLSFGAWTVYEYFVTNQPSGYPTIICLIVFLASLQFIILGILGEYIGRIHIESKNRPLYFAQVIEGSEAQKNEGNVFSEKDLEKDKSL